MKILRIALLIFLACSPAFAETYAVERPDGSVAIVYYQDGSSDSVEDVLRDAGLEGFPVKKISPSDLPTSRKDRKYWMLSPVGKKVQVDTDKKAEDEAIEAQKKAEAEAVLVKLKITSDELKKLEALK